MAVIKIDLPETTAKAAREAGLLTGVAIERLLMDAIKRRQAAGALLSVADRLARTGTPRMTMKAIDLEIKAARAGWRKRAGGS